MRNTLKKNASMYGPSVLSGTALIFCFPWYDFSLLAWFALTPFFISLADKKPREAFNAGFFMGLVYFFGTLYWIYHSINHYGSIPFIPSLAIVFLLCMYLSLYTGIFGMLFSWKISTTRLPALLLAPVFWVTLEYIRAHALTGFPWSSIGYSQYKFLNAIQIADITGIYGVSFLVVAVNGAFADFFIIRKRLRLMPLFSLSHTVIGLFALAVCVIAVFLYGSWRLDETRTGKQVRISVIQGNIAQDRKMNPTHQREVLDTYSMLSRSVSVMQPSLIVWPEASVPFYFNADKELSQELIAFQQEIQAPLLFGSVLVKEPSHSTRTSGLTNSAVLLALDGKPTFIYDKIHLVPFGEYVPLRKILFFVDKLVADIGDFIPGGHNIRAETPYGSFGVLICYEIIFPELVRKFYSKGGDFIVTITNDAWFGKSAGPWQHFSMGVFRAVENRKPLARAANTGISGFIDSNGRILGMTPLFAQAAMTMDIFTDQTRSFYTRYGDLFAYLCFVTTVFILININRR